MLLKPREAAEYFNVSKTTLRRWANEGKIDYIRTAKNHRRYKVENKDNRENFIYARVSSSKQKKDLERQVKFLKSKYKDYTVITDIGSGANFNRKGLQLLMGKVIKNNVGTIAIAYKDRLSRFGYDFFEWLCCKFGTRISVEKNKSRNAEQELAEDIVTIITHFSAKYHGSRNYTKRENSDLSEFETEEKID